MLILLKENKNVKLKIASIHLKTKDQNFDTKIARVISKIEAIKSENKYAFSFFKAISL